MAYYRKPDGRPTSEIHNYRVVVRALRQLYGHTLVRDFGPVALKALRARWVAEGIVRRQVNGRVGRVKRIFAWGVEEQLIPPAVSEALRSVRGLTRGRSEARESVPVTPVSDEQLEKTLPFLSPTVAAMVRVQWYTGMRPARSAPCAGTRSTRPGPYGSTGPEVTSPSTTGRAGSSRSAPARRPYCKPTVCQTTTGSSSPRPAPRPTATPSGRRTGGRPDTRPTSGGTRPSARANPRRQPGTRYTEGGYRRAIARACEAAWPPPDDLLRKRANDADGRSVLESVSAWKDRLGAAGRVELARWRGERCWYPHQLRHSAATRIRQRFGIEAARTVLGHSDIDTSEIYAERDQDLAAAGGGGIGVTGSPRRKRRKRTKRPLPTGPGRSGDD